MTIAVAMRTANRAPKSNYVGSTLKRLQAAGVDLTALHLCVTDAKADWIEKAIDGLPRPKVYVPGQKLRANENALRQVEVALSDQPDWVLLLEDDLAFCADFLGSVDRWLARHARPDRQVYRLFGFTRPPRRDAEAYDWPLQALQGSQAVLLRAREAEQFLAWGRANLTTWRQTAPWGSSKADPMIAFDKLLAAWALTRWPSVPGVMSHPYFVNHIGTESSLHSRGRRNDGMFAGQEWSYRPVVSEVA
jgi:hypothetical protein